MFKAVQHQRGGKAGALLSPVIIKCSLTRRSVPAGFALPGAIIHNAANVNFGPACTGLEP
jgi:hypothetical protein